MGDARDELAQARELFVWTIRLCVDLSSSWASCSEWASSWSVTFCSLSFSWADIRAVTSQKIPWTPIGLPSPQEWHLHGLDVALVALGGDMLFDHVQDLSAFDHFLVIPAVLFGEFPGVEFEVGLPFDLFEGGSQLAQNFWFANVKRPSRSLHRII